MSIDIIIIDPSKPINNKYVVCSGLPTGPRAPFYNRRVIRSNYPRDLTIENIESKFDERFDNPSYYYGGGYGVDGGDVA